MKKEYEIIDKEYSKRNLYIGKKINRLTIHDIVRVKSTNSEQIVIMAIVSCECNPSIMKMTSLHGILSGKIKSCGCYKYECFNNNRKNIKALKYLGKKYITNQGYTIEVIGVVNSHNVTVKFLYVKKGEEYSTQTTMQNVKKGEVRYPFHRNEFGGYLGVGKYTCRKNGKKTKAYRIWFAMLLRCYDSNKKSYYGKVKVCKEWLNFQNFAEWFYKNDYDADCKLAIDKDLLSKVNGCEKIYSSKTCIIIPMEINNMLRSGLLFTKYTIQDVLKCAEKYKEIMPENIYTKLINSLHKLN